MQHTLTVPQFAILFTALIALVYAIVVLASKAAEKKYLSTIWNYPLIKSRFEELKHDIQFAPNKTELEFLEDAVEQFYYDFDSVKSHSIVLQYFTSLRDQVIFKRQDLNDSRNISKVALAVLVWLVVMGLCSSCTTGRGCYATKGMIGYHSK